MKFCFSDINAKKLVFICSAYKGDVENNALQARRYCLFVHTQGYVPFAPHLLYPQILSDDIPEEREAGFKMGLKVLTKCDELWIFGEKLTEGMRWERVFAMCMGKTVRYFDRQCHAVE